MADNAQTNHVSFENELARVMIHGILHFAGYPDKGEEEKRIMTEKENFYLNRFQHIQG